jgi:hypothetical protein
VKAPRRVENRTIMKPLQLASRDDPFARRFMRSYRRSSGQTSLRTRSAR